MRDSQNKLRLIWADKIALVLAVLVAVIPAIGWALIGLATGMAGANHVLASIGTDGAAEVLAMLVAVWLSLRAIDFAFGGSTYKLFHAEPAAHASPVLPTNGNLLAH